MSLIEDAKRLNEIGSYCDACSGSPISGHIGGCIIPRIVRALEAAQWSDLPFVQKLREAMSDAP